MFNTFAKYVLAVSSMGLNMQACEQAFIAKKTDNCIRIPSLVKCGICEKAGELVSWPDYKGGVGHKRCVESTVKYEEGFGSVLAAGDAAVKPASAIEQANICSVCKRKEDVVVWAHFEGDMAHKKCIKLVAKIESETEGGLLNFFTRPSMACCGNKVEPSNFYDIHRFIIMYVRKICYPKTIEQFVKTDDKEFVEKTFACACDLGFLHYFNQKQPAVVD